MKKTFFLILCITVFFGGCGTVVRDQGGDNINTEKPVYNEPGEETTLPKTTEPSENSLDLSGKNLKKVPEYIFSETKLEQLDISNNLLTGAIQAEIRHLQRLRVLDASNNQMTGVPAEVGQLTNLEVLNLSNNQLTGLPYELGNLKNLKTLNISGNNYSELDLGIIQENLPSSVNIIK